MKMRTTILALAFCFGAGCGGEYDEEEPVTSALSQPETGVDQGDAPPVAKKKGAGPKKTPVSTIDKRCTEATNRCMKACDSVFPGTDENSARGALTCYGYCFQAEDKCRKQPA